LTDNAREKTGKDVFDWVREAVDLGAGEILLTSVDREGTGKGFDLELLKKVSAAVNVPVIASGGAGNCAHFLDALNDGLADALSAASFFHYYYLHHLTCSGTFKEEGNIEFINSSRGSTEFLKGRIEPAEISAVKEYLCGAGVSCRLTREHGAGTGQYFVPAAK